MCEHGKYPAYIRLLIAFTNDELFPLQESPLNWSL